jgi:aspartyl protease family protein
VVELDYISVAGARVEHVPALVLEEGLETSLLGMTYLGRLSKFEATQSALILRP